jgi:hypothetical protein
MKKIFGASCSRNDQCQDSGFLKCLNGFCMCPAGYQFAGSKCGKFSNKLVMSPFEFKKKNWSF